MEVVRGNQWFIPGQSATFRSKLGSADANNHLAWGYSVADEPYEFDVKTAYVYDHTFFRITVQNDYSDDIVSVSKFTCTPEADKAVAATCTKAGLTEGSHCRYCKKVLTAQKATPATGHQYIPSQESYPNPEATLSKDGRLVSPQVCKNCDDEYEKTAVIPKIGTVKLSKTAYTYNGKVQRPGVVVKDRTGKALKGVVDYNVSYPKGMKNVGKLKAKKKYYVRVRTYKTVKFGGKSVKLYSGWSKAKSVTTKK